MPAIFEPQAVFVGYQASNNKLKQPALFYPENYEAAIWQRRF
jgi:hypothetical protein